MNVTHARISSCAAAGVGRWCDSVKSVNNIRPRAFKLVGRVLCDALTFRVMIDGDMNPSSTGYKAVGYDVGKGGGIAEMPLRAEPQSRSSCLRRLGGR